MKPGALTIASACIYEAESIITGKTPTFTALCRARPVTVRVLVLALFTGWLWCHMLRGAMASGTPHVDQEYLGILR